MSCPDYDLLISRYLDNALDDEARMALQLHLAQCPSCRWTLERYRRLDNGLREIPAPKPDTAARRTLFQKSEKYNWALATLRNMSRPIGSFVIIALSFCLIAYIMAFVIVPAIFSKQPTVNNVQLSTTSTTFYQDIQTPRLRPVSGDDALAEVISVPELVEYLPPASSIEQLAARWGAINQRPTYLQIVFVAPNGERLLFERSLVSTGPPIDLEWAPDKAMIIHGQTWLYGRRFNSEGSPVARMIRYVDTAGQTEVTQLARLDELLQSLERLR